MSSSKVAWLLGNGLVFHAFTFFCTHRMENVEAQRGERVRGGQVGTARKAFLFQDLCDIK